MRHTKILATLGPASAKADIVEAMILAGADAIRLNFSHGDHDWHRETYQLVREVARKLARPLAILHDLQGPKVRVGEIRGGSMALDEGSTLTITTRSVIGERGVVSTSYEDLPSDVEVGRRILLDDGKISLLVEEVRSDEITCRVKTGGVLLSKKGINVPGSALSTPALTEKDREDARFALSLGTDYLALSFVRRAKDIRDLRAVMKTEGRSVPIVAKIEKTQAIENLEEIVATADGVMVARGDLGVEATLEMIPAFQKRIIHTANQAGKLVITATQMLESMTERPFPTRAEVTDVANAILDGTDVVMLSGETAVGKYPVEVVKRMAAIAATTEDNLYPFSKPVSAISPAVAAQEGFFLPFIARMAGHASRDLDPRAIVAFTRNGRTARILAYERPRAPVIAFTTDERVMCQMALFWGVIPRLIREISSVEDLLATGEKLLIEGKWARRDDTVIFLVGTTTSPGATNSLKIARVGELEREGPRNAAR